MLKNLSRVLKLKVEFSKASWPWIDCWTLSIAIGFNHVIAIMAFFRQIMPNDLILAKHVAIVGLT